MWSFGEAEHTNKDKDVLYIVETMQHAVTSSLGTVTLANVYAVIEPQFEYYMYNLIIFTIYGPFSLGFRAVSYT